MALGKAEHEELALLVKTLVIPCQFNSNTTVANQRVFARWGGANLFTKTDGQTITAYDAAPGFTTSDLDDSGSNAIMGIIVPVGDAQELLEIRVDLSSVTAVTVAAPSAVVFTKKGTGTPAGVTASNNISAIFQLTGTDGDSATGNVYFTITIRYRAKQP